MVIKSFKDSHPLVLFTYFISVILLLIIQRNYVFIIFGFGSVLLLAYFCSKRDLIKQFKYLLILLLLLTITNPLFVSEGFDILYQNSYVTITKQAIIYGFIFGLMIVSVIVLFIMMKHYLSDSHLIYLFGSVLPTLGLVLSMSFNLINKLKLQYQKIKEANKMLPCTNKFKKYRDIAIILVTYAFESSLEMMNSMNGRGYGKGKRSNFHLYVFKNDDLLRLIIIILLDFVCFYGYSSFYHSFYYYPIIQVYQFRLLDLFFLGSFMMLILLPLFKGGNLGVSN